MRYLISYDLSQPGQNYAAVVTALESIGARRVLYSQWVVRRGNTTCAGLRDWLRGHTDANDRVLVVELDGTGWASYNTMTDINTI
jgi:CRISPR/Cas system-associated endoribonuclease Cas2